jgi:glycosyltransferase involved in cell wall biosynthesis
MKKWLLFLRKGLKGVIAISWRMAEKLREAGIPEEMILVAHDAVDLDVFNDTSHVRPETRKALGYKETDCVALYAGKFDSERGVYDLIEIAPSLPHIQFLLIGASDSQIRELAPIIPQNVKVIRYMPHKMIPGYLAAADILLSPHRSTTNIIDVCSPLKLFEYMAMSRPIVIADFPVFKEILEPGVEAFFYEADNNDSLIETLKLVSSSPDSAGRAAAAARRKVQNCSWKERAYKIREFMGERLKI